MPESPPANGGSPAGPSDGGPLARGARVGRYVLGDEIGRGGMGVVYRAHDAGLGRDVAVKVLPSSARHDPDLVARLRAEARAASSLDHPHVCTVYEVGETEPDGDGACGHVFVAMACYAGEALDARLARGPVAIAEAVSVARQVALGLGAAHRKGIVHRDVKPSNVFLTTDTDADGWPCVKLLDFGVAHVEGAVPLPRPGTTLGTLEYAAPEQAHGRVESASDQWGLGVMLYEMLAGRRPFDEPYEAALLYAVLNADPVPVRDHRPEVPAALAAVVGRLLAREPADRFATAEAAALTASLVPGAVGLAGGAAWAIAEHSVPDEKHVAVLPFRTDGGAAGQAFADGLAESLTGGLTQLEQYQGALWVVPASEVRAQRVASPSAAREALGVTLVVTGAVQRSGRTCA